MAAESIFYQWIVVKCIKEKRLLYGYIGQPFDDSNSNREKA